MEENFYKYELQRKNRIENFLRNEVRILREEINNLKMSRFQKYKNKIINRFFKNKKKNKNVVNKTVDLIIPVFGRIDLVEKLLESIKKSDFDNTLKSIILVDDKFDEFSTRSLQRISETDSLYKLIQNESNLGFKDSVNKAFRMCSSELVVIINSDVEVPPNWFKEIQEVFLNLDIGLATALSTKSANNLEIILPPGLNWLELNRKINENSRLSSFDACTAIGYFLAVKKELILENEDLFSEEFQHGYGEDSDLHYRILDKGYKSVAVANLVVSHEGSASYSLNRDHQAIQQRALGIFEAKHGERHINDLAEFNKLNSIKQTQNFIKHLPASRTAEVVIVAEQNNIEIGGLATLNKIQNTFIQIGINSLFATFSPNIVFKDSHFSEILFFELPHDIKPKVILFSNFNLFKEIKNRFQMDNVKIIFIMQGPDYILGDSIPHQDGYIKMLQSVDLVVAVSPFLANQAKFLGAKKVETVVLGPSRNIFYRNKNQPKENIIVLPTRVDMEKGLKYLIPIFDRLKDKKIQIIGYGDLPYSSLSEIFTEHLGRISSTEVANLLRRSKLLLDMSTIEGLGLSALEAIMCDCSCVIAERGGTNQILEKENIPFYWINNPIYTDLLYEKTLDAFNSYEKNKEFFKDDYSWSWEKNINRLIQIVKEK